MSNDDLDHGTVPDEAAEIGQETRSGVILRRLQNLSVHSKFLMMMLFTSLLSLGTVSFIAYKTGRDALVSEITSKLTALRASKKQQLEWYFDHMQETMLVLGENNFVREVFLSFRTSYDEVRQTPASKQQIEKLRQYYKKEFMTRFEGAVYLTKAALPPNL